MPSTIRVDSIVVTPGARFGLAEPTASCIWTVDGVLGDGAEALRRLREGVAQLRPSEPLHGVGAQDWPRAFLVAESPADGIAAWGVALTVAIQRLARDPVGRGRVVGNRQGQLCVALPWQREALFTEAMTWAMRHLLAWLWPEEYPQEQQQKLQESFDRWLSAAQRRGLSPNSLRFAMAARQRDIPVSSNTGILRLGWGVNAERMDSSFTGRTSNIAVRLAKQKNLAAKVLRAGGIPVPASEVAADWAQALKAAQALGYPVVIKPSDQDQGLGVVPGIRDEAMLRRAYDAAAKFSPGSVIVEQHVDGEDHRMLVVGGRLLMTTRRIPGGVTGDGIHSVSELIARINADPLRGATKRSLLIALKLDDEAQDCLAEQALKDADIPVQGRFVKLRRTANISTGGTAIDVTAQVHADNRRMAERCASLVGLDIAGVDFLCADISRSWREVGGAVCEVNAQPGFRPHWLGDPERDVNGEIIDWLFRDKPARIPVVAIAQGGDSATVARLLHRIWLASGVQAGVSTSRGVWIGADAILERAQPDFSDAALLLNEPTLQAAILELPLQVLARHGQPCDRYDAVAIVDSGAPSAASSPDAISARAAIARLHAETLRRGRAAVVLHADAESSPALRAYATAATQVLVTRDAQSAALRRHLSEGGSAVFLAPRQGAVWVVVSESGTESPVLRLAGEVLERSGGALLYAVALARTQGLSIATIRAGLSRAVG